MQAAQILDRLMEAIPASALDSEAFLGFKPYAKGGIAVRLCPWCQGQQRVRDWAAENGMPVTDGICTTHFQAQLHSQGLD